MNIFAFDADPQQSSEWLCDTHANKMCLETVQILNTVVHGTEKDHLAFYKPTHQHHPCVKWAGANRQNYNWLLDYAVHIGREYESRFDRTHASIDKLHDSQIWMVDLCLDTSQSVSDFAQAVPEDCTGESSFEAYKRYYARHKASEDWFTYDRGRAAPAWLEAYK